MSVKITQIEGHKFKVEYKGVEIVSGRVNPGSAYEGMSPGALMTASLGLCTAMHVETYLSQEGIEYGGITVSLSNKYERAPARARAPSTSKWTATSPRSRERDCSKRRTGATWVIENI